MPEFDKGLDAPILDFMSIQAVDLRKLVKIVRQYEVIYGGGISSGDAAVREDCETLVGILESELGGKKGQAGQSLRKSSLPSLVDAKKRPKGEVFPRPTSARATEIAKLGSPGKSASEPREKLQKKPSPPKEIATSKADAKKAVAQQQAPTKPAAVKPPVARPSPKTEPKASAVKATTKPVPLKAAGKGAPTEIARRVAQSVPSKDDEVYKDVRSRYSSASKAAEERADKIAGSAYDSGDVEIKHSFAALHLFDAFKKNRLPKYGGFIVCIRFTEETGYTVFEIIGYENMQDIYPDGDTLVFKSVGCKLYAIVEPAGYLLKSVEPPNRPSEQMVPYRFSELLRITTKRFQNVLIGRKPVFMPTSFSVFKPSGEDLAVLFYDQAEVYANIQDFLIMVMRDRLGLPKADARKAAEVIAKGIREFRLWMDEA